MGRIAFTSALLLALIGCSTPPAASVPAAEPGGTSGSSAALVETPAGPRRGAAAVAPRAASSAERGFPFGEPLAEWIPATPWNYDRGRFGEPVQFVVIHYTAISYERTLRAFTSPASGVSAHYVVRQDGHVTQMVSEEDTAWQAGHYWFNVRSIGIELELGLEDGTSRTFTPAQYYSTAALVCGIAARHGLPLDKAHVIGHNEIPGVGKIDPGPTWDWPHFMWLTSLCAPPSTAGLNATVVSQTPYPELEVGSTGTVSVILKNTGTVAWRKGGSTEIRLGIPGDETRPAVQAEAWALPERPAIQAEEVVAPGGTATFTFPVNGRIAGSHVIPLRPVVEGVTWLPDQGIYTMVTVRASDPPIETASE